MSTTTQGVGQNRAAARRPLKVGLMLPQTDGMRGPGTRRWRELAPMARLAEDVGFDSLWVVDHFLYLLEGEASARGCWESWTLLSALAATTARVELGTLVLGMGFRNPALLAKMAETLDEVSGGRLILGVGSGYHQHEYRAFGYPHDHRISRFEESIQILHALLKHGQVDFEGQYYSARDCELKPRGPRVDGPPILIGGISPRMLGIIARYADQWNVYYDDTTNDIAGARTYMDRVDAACQATGRDPATLARTVTVLIADPNADPWWTRLPTGRDMKVIRPLTGDTQAIAEELRGYARLGVSHIQISLEPTTLATIENLARVLEVLERS
ncbi:MAG: LLM class flavin-dependent oxidoreductase [Gammaproteobacteria bacterium]|nr:LLM class flavin-dependent oxidoreductase [Gammaproteobacteria bacterium]